jgi:hypothetical protein
MLVTLLPLSPPLNPFPAPLKAIARASLILFHTGIRSPSTIYRHLNLLHSPSLPPHTVLILLSCFSLLISKSMFRVSQCMPTVIMLSFGLVNLPLFSLTFFQQLLIHILISSTFTSCVMRYYWCLIILFSFHRVDPLLQICSTSEFVYGHACFCVYAYYCCSVSALVVWLPVSLGPWKALWKKAKVLCHNP